MRKKIRVLFHSLDGAGVNYFRIQSPAMQLQMDHSDDFHVEIENQQLDFSNPEVIERLKTFDIIQYHRQLAPDTNQMISLKKILNDAGTVLVADIDDYWLLDKSHPFYYLSAKQRFHERILESLKLANYVTTTTDLFASEIRKVTGKDNVLVFPNSVDPEWQTQFKNNWKPSEDGKVRIIYAGGSSHLNDLQQLRGTINLMRSDTSIKDKFRIILAGWDTQGKTTDIKFSQQLQIQLQQRGLWNQTIIKEINKSEGDIDRVSGIPMDLKNAFRGKMFDQTERPIRNDESVYLQYEYIFTDNYRLINNTKYVDQLKKIEIGDTDGDNYSRRWTQKANVYAKVLDEADIWIAPLADNTFNKMKSNLKQVEAWTRKLPMVATDIPPYNVDGINDENCLLIPLNKKSDRLWYKALKKLILDKDYRKQLGENLYRDFSEKYNLKNVTNNRSVFYKSLIKEEVAT